MPDTRTSIIDENWSRAGLCRTSKLGPDAWFPYHPKESIAVRAKSVCRVCPVRERCADESLKIPGTRGIWAGVDEWTRQREAAKP